MKNIHLIPPMVIDTCEKLFKATSINERDNLVIRIEATRDYCAKALETAEKTKQSYFKKRN